jgi:hypothetical protein
MPFESLLDKYSVLLLILYFILPGLIAMHVYRLVFPAKAIQWQNILVESTFWGTIIFLFISFFAFLLWLPTWLLEFSCYLHLHSFVYFTLWFIAELILAIFLPLFWLRMVYKYDCLTFKFILPHPSAWDYFFLQRTSCFVIVHLKDNTKIAGFYGSNSFATSYPGETNIYLESLMELNAEGKIIDRIQGSKGMFISNNAFDVIEFFDFDFVKNQIEIKEK